MKIFLSSTALDLNEHRAVADDTLLRLSQTSIAMERFGAMPDTPATECERLASEADVIICIVAHRYGSGITRREVEAGLLNKKAVYAWIVDDSYAWSKVKEQDRLNDQHVLNDSSRILEVAAAVGNLRKFKEWLRSTVVVESFTTPDDLGRKIAIALGRLPPTKHGERSNLHEAVSVKYVHPLQPAPNFFGRDALITNLVSEICNTSSPDRVHALIAAGGTGKTAAADQVVVALKQRQEFRNGAVLVWSFYDNQNVDAFFYECATFFSELEFGDATGDGLLYAQRGLRNGRPNLIVLDGLERVQLEAGGGAVRGELQDHRLKILLRSVCQGLGRCRALLTSRFPLVDLADWMHRGFVEARLEDLESPAARCILRKWGVKGNDEDLNLAIEQVGGHALSVDVIGSYLHHFGAGDISLAASFRLDDVVGDDPKAAKLARVLGFYADKLPADEREVLARLSVFQQGVNVDLLGVAAGAGARPGKSGFTRQALTQLLRTLERRGLVFGFLYRARDRRYTAHPFVRERFASLVGCPSTEVFEAVAQWLGSGLERRTKVKPRVKGLLDRYENLIDATRRAGRIQEAFDLYWDGIGAYRQLGYELGDHARGYRILTSFVSTSKRFTTFGEALTAHDRCIGLNELALYADALGHLSEAEEMRAAEKSFVDRLPSADIAAVFNINAAQIALRLGKLQRALGHAKLAEDLATARGALVEVKNAISVAGIAAHYMGNVEIANAEFTHARGLENAPYLYSTRGQHHATSLLNFGLTSDCHDVASAGLLISKAGNVREDIPGWHALLARIALARGESATAHIQAVAESATRTGEMEWIIEGYSLAALKAFGEGNIEAALSATEAGILRASTCGYKLMHIELLTIRSRVYKALPDLPRAVVAARVALDLSSAEGCQFAWGEANAAEAWGNAYEAQGDTLLAHRAFSRAIQLMEKMRHPSLGVMKEALVRTGGERPR